MVCLTILAVSSVLPLSAVPVQAQPAGPVVPVVPAPVYHDHDWRAYQRERAYHQEQHRLKAEEHELDRTARTMLAFVGLADAADRNIAVVVPAALQLEHIKFELGSGSKHLAEVLGEHGIILEDQPEAISAFDDHSMDESMR